ncbi:MAG: HPr(Ser) kinase/phosphatase [Xanthomonadales bacterium]|nr:HPr(Ser) kinase/phosphatase [Xanthomonadales bacterium]
MSRRLSVASLFEELSARLRLSWSEPQKGGRSHIDASENRARRPTLVGYLNLIHANKVQILGREEIAYLDALSVRTRRATLRTMIALKPAVILVARGLSVPEDLAKLAADSDVALWTSPMRGHELLTYLQYHLARALAERVTLHGVFLEVYSIGVLLTGESGSGKSELALELITRGHRLIADDATEFTLIAPDVIDGTCPELLRDCLEVRGLGVLNVRNMFGDTAVKKNKYLRLILHLAPEQDLAQADPEARLFGSISSRTVLGVDVTQLAIPVAAGRNLAVLVEAAVRNHVLKSGGIDAAQIFVDRQAHQMRRMR